MAKLSLKPRFEWITLDAARALGFEDMVVLNWEDVETDQQDIPFAIDWAGYYALERLGVLKFGALLLGPRLIGYSVWFLQPPLHHKNTTWAANDVVYADPDYRARHGLVLMRKAEAALAEMGVKVITYMAKPRQGKDALDYRRGRDSIGYLLQRLGYRLSEEAWLKIL